MCLKSFADAVGRKLGRSPEFLAVKPDRGSEDVLPDPRVQSARTGRVRGDEPEGVAPRKSEVHGGEEDPGQVLDSITAADARTELRPVKVDHVQFDAFLLNRSRVQQKMADIAVAVVQAAAVHPGDGRGQSTDDAVLERGRRRVRLPVAAEILQRDHADEVFCHQKRLHGGGVDAADAERAGCHGGHAEFVQQGDREVFVRGSRDGKFELDQVFPDLAPADRTVKFDEIRFAVHAEAHGLAVLDVAEATSPCIFDIVYIFSLNSLKSFFLAFLKT